MFCVHRFFFVFSVFWLEGRPFAQLSTVSLSTFFLLLYLIILRPFQEKADNFLSILNTLFLLLLYLVGFLLASSLHPSASPALGMLLLFFILCINVANITIILILKFKSCCCPRRSKARVRSNVERYVDCSSTQTNSLSTAEAGFSGMVPTSSMKELCLRVPGMAEEAPFSEHPNKPVNRQQQSIAHWGARMLGARKY